MSQDTTPPPPSSNAPPPYRATIESAWIDYNGHLRDAYYGLIMSYAVDEFMDHAGLDAAYRARTGCTLYTLELHLHYLHEVKRSDALAVETLVLDADAKRLHVGCRFTCPRVSGAVASAEAMMLHVRQGDTPQSTPFPDAVDRTLQALKLAADARAAWSPASRRLEIRRR